MCREVNSCALLLSCLSPELQWWVCGHKAAESEILSKRGFPPSCPIRLADGVSVPVAIDLQFFFQTRGRQQPSGSLCNSPPLLARVPVRLPPPMFSWRGGVGSQGRRAPGPGGAPSGASGSGCQAGPFWLQFSRGQGQRGEVSRVCGEAAEWPFPRGSGAASRLAA